MFFDDISVYSSSWKEHLQHLSMTFSILRACQLFVKRTKCEFAQQQINYLGYVISKEGVSMDKEVVAVANWIQPKSLKSLRAFLGLAG